MADKAIYSVDTVTSMSGTDKVYVNTGNNIKQITKDNLCGNVKNDLANKVSNVTYTGNSLDYSSDLNSIKDSIITTYFGWAGSGGEGQPTEKVTGLFMSVNMGDSVLQIIRGVDADTQGYMRFYSVKTNKWTNWK